MPTEALSPAHPDSYVGVGRQSAKGTGVAPTHFLAYTGAVELNHEPNIRQVREAGGGDMIARLNKDFVAPGLTAAAPLRPDLGAALCAWFLGADAISGVSDPWTHTITKAPGNVWLSIERSIADDVIERIIDGFATELTLDYRKRSSGPELMVTAAFGGLDTEPQGAATAESYETDAPYARSMCAWTVDGAAATNVESFTATMRWRYDEAMLADALNRVAAAKLHLEIGLELVQLFDSTAERDAYLSTHYGTPAGTDYTEAVFQGDINVVATQSAARTFTVDLPQVQWGVARLPGNDPDASEAVRLTRTGQVIANPGGEPVTITALNGVSTGYLA